MAKQESDGRSAKSWWRVVALVARDRDYRAIAVEALLLGIDDGLLVPYLALWVTRGLHGTTWQASFIYVPFGLVVVTSGLLMSAYSDRVAKRRGLIVVSLLLSCLARAALAFISVYPLAVVLYAVTGFGPFGLIFALLRDAIQRKERDGGPGAFVTTLVRSVYSVGWLIGPVLGGIVIELSGFRGLFFAGAVLLLAAAGWAALEISDQRPGKRTGPARPPRLERRHFLLLTLLFLIGLCLLAGDEGRASFLSLYLTRDLHQSISSVGWTFSISIFSELILIPVAGRLADRFGVLGIYFVGIAVQAAYFFAMSAASAYWFILSLQVVYAFVVATVSGVGIVFAQSLVGSDRTALSTSTYLVSGGLARVLNSVLLGIGFVAANLARLFAVFGALACAALALVVIVTVLARGAADRPDGTGAQHQADVVS